MSSQRASEVPVSSAILRRWRQHRGLPQLALALEVGVSGRHLSFIESGRARASRGLLLRLAEVLEMPLREQNEMLERAGYARAFRESPIGAADMAPITRAIDLMLAHHEPYGALVVDRHWNIVRANDAQRRLLGQLLPPDRLGGRLNHMDLLFAPDGLRPFVENWTALARALLRRLAREVLSAHGDEETLALRQRLLAYPGVQALAASPDSGEPLSPVLDIVIRKGPMRLALFSVISAIGTPLDVTAQELRIESFFPVDDVTADVLRQFAEAPRGQPEPAGA
jgi:transcriptional regulator with XRE-family HTH domain